MGQEKFLTPKYCQTSQSEFKSLIVILLISRKFHGNSKCPYILKRHAKTIEIATL